jgi:hypothetical protein
MRKIMLIAAAIGGLTALGGTVAMAAPMGNHHDAVRYEAPRHSPVMRTGYEWHHRHWNHRRWDHDHWRYYN